MDLEQFTGTEHWYQHPYYPDMLYTDGVKYFAEKAECYWFLDIVGTEFSPNLMKVNPKWDYFVVITLSSENNKATITVDDGNMPGGTVFATKNVEYTDCPEGEWKFYYLNGVMILPSEY